MVPTTIREKLASLRRRERALTFAWGLSRWIALVIVTLLVCGFIDWLIDRDRDTPFIVRLFLTSFLVVVATVSEVLWIMWPQMRRLPDDSLALWVEGKVPEFEHRLISAVQLNQPEARLEGMSQELVAVVTREAESRAKRVPFVDVADHRRFKWSIAVLAPVLLVALIPVAIAPRVSFALLVRQFFFPMDIPHSVELEPESASVWLAGEEIPIRFRVKGAFHSDMVGRAFVQPEGDRGAYYPLKFIKHVGNDAIFGVDAKPSTAHAVNLSGRLSDGRTKSPVTMQLVSRPIIADKDNQAWVILPAYCGTKPKGGRYEKPTRPGEVALIAGSGVRVRVEVQKPIREARIELLGPDLSTVVKSIDMKIEEGKKHDSIADQEMDVSWAEGSFDHADGLAAYQVIVKDEFGFDNAPYPQRKLKVVPEDPPTITLLRDTFGLGADFDLDGLPVVLGQKIRIPYRCDGPYGLGRAVVHYRLLKKHESGNEPEDDEKFTVLPLSEMKATESSGPFDPRTGAFANMDHKQEVPFHAAPSPVPDVILGRTIGGGRAFLHTNGLIDSASKTLKLKTGDQIEYFIEVFARDRQPAGSTPSVRSESRVVTVLDDKAWRRWLREVGQEDERIRQLEAKTRAIFERPK